jgi:hypothetical protein
MSEDPLRVETIRHCLFCDNHPSDEGHYQAQQLPVGTQDGTTVHHLLLTCVHAREEHGITGNELMVVAPISFLVIVEVHYSDNAMKLRVGASNYEFLQKLGEEPTEHQGEEG